MDIHEKILGWENNAGVDIFKKFELSETAKIVDYGCGFGHYSIAAAKALNDQSTIYGVDINKESNKFLAAKAKEEGLENIDVQPGSRDYSLNFEDESLDLILYYDIFHGNGDHKFRLIKEAKRTLKRGGIMSVLPFHLSNFRDMAGKKKKYTYKKITEEILEFGFLETESLEQYGIHFEKYHSPYYMNKGGVEFEQLETAKILNYKKL